MPVMAVVSKFHILVKPVVEQAMRKRSHTVTVKIPAGVETGQQIGFGWSREAGFNGGPYGDLFVIIQVQASDKFEREGTTIYYKLNLNFVQAALGIRSMYQPSMETLIW